MNTLKQPPAYRVAEVDARESRNMLHLELTSMRRLYLEQLNTATEAGNLYAARHWRTCVEALEPSILHLAQARMLGRPEMGLGEPTMEWDDEDGSVSATAKDRAVMVTVWLTAILIGLASYTAVAIRLWSRWGS